MKKRRRVLALFIRIFLRNRSFCDAREFCGKKRKLGKGNLYLTENRLSWNKMCCASVLLWRWNLAKFLLRGVFFPQMGKYLFGYSFSLKNSNHEVYKLVLHSLPPPPLENCLGYWWNNCHLQQINSNFSSFFFFSQMNRKACSYIVSFLCGCIWHFQCNF